MEQLVQEPISIFWAVPESNLIVNTIRKEQSKHRANS